MTSTALSLPLQPSALSFDQTSNQLKTDKFFPHEDESEISTWFKMENEPLPGVGLGVNGTDNSMLNFASASNPYSFSHTINSTDNPTAYFPFSYMSSSVPRSAGVSSHDSGENSQISSPSQTLSGSDFPNFGSAFGFTPLLSTNATQSPLPPSGGPSQLQMSHPSAQPSPGPQYVNPQHLQIPTLQQHSIHLSSFPSQITQQFPSQFASQLNPPFNQTPPFSLPLSQQGQQVQQAQQLAHVATQLGPQLQQLSNTLSNILQSTMTNPNLVTFQQQHLVPLYQLFSQFQQLFKSQMPLVNPTAQQLEELNDEKKKKAARPFVKRVRQTRPKVVEAKGAVQCKGRNRKKGTQCRNAALMEYIGPRPIYCAEHIELDPKSLYEKCKSTYQKDPCDNKGCKEVVLKEFGYCYKHYSDLLNELVLQHEFTRILRHQTRIGELLNQLEREAAAAKKKDGDLYQRKNKLIPKFQEMKRLVSKVMDTFRISPSGNIQSIDSDGSTSGVSAQKDPSELSPDDLVNDLSSARDDSISPILSLSEEESILGSESSSDSDFSEVDTVC